MRRTHSGARRRVFALCALLYWISMPGGLLRGETLRQLASRGPLQLFTCFRGAVMPNSTDQTNNLAEGDKCLLLSSSNLTDLDGISKLQVRDGEQTLPLALVPRLHLFCNHNQITALPEELADLDQVVFLYFESNRLATLPRALLDMDSLEGMYFTSNRFTEIPDFIFEMTRLKKLQFSHNNISELPPEIGRLTELRHFNMADNQIATVPGSISRLTRLRVCDLSDNRLSELPESFGQVQIVNQLRVRNNPLKRLPSGFVTMRATIDITGTDIDLLSLTPEMQAKISTEKPPGSKVPEDIIVSSPPKDR